MPKKLKFRVRITPYVLFSLFAVFNQKTLSILSHQSIKDISPKNYLAPSSSSTVSGKQKFSDLSRPDDPERKLVLEILILQWTVGWRRWEQWERRL